ncbi:MAG: GLUG motif-containing protein, partial [Solirubrobacteraceae bacterium]
LDTTSTLAINDRGYGLAKDVSSLASAVVLGWQNVALVNDYDAAGDGTYQGAAIPVILSGSFEGLGHTLRNLSVSGDPANDAGMFELIGNDARDFTLTNVNIAVGDARSAGALAGEVDGTISHVSVSGQVGAGSGGSTGGLVGYAAGSIVNSFSSATVVSGSHGEAGGLAGRALSISFSQASGNVTIGNHGAAGGLAGKIFSPTGIPLVAQSFATGNVRSGGANNADAIGGLVGQAGRDIAISDCYATGSVQAGGASRLGGLVGESDAQSIAGSYAIGAVTLNAAGRHKQARVGGFIGDHGLGALSQDYWDVDSSGQGNACGQICQGVTGLTDAELKSGLPAGFDSAIWGQSAAINNGYPYLLANPPQ